MKEPITPELLRRAARFYDQSPTGQYDQEASIALTILSDMIERGEIEINQKWAGVKQ